ncbi:MAG TPA: hypothetical protein VK178_01795 [Opitutaceae bacterium]|nr:hypothetical protein [Opitutaceae bacterium]
MHRVNSTPTLQRLRPRARPSWLRGGALAIGEPQLFPTATIFHLHDPTSFVTAGTPVAVAVPPRPTAQATPGEPIRVPINRPPLGSEPAPDVA